MLSRVGLFRRGFASLAVKNFKLETAAPLAAVGKDQVAIALVASPVHAADIKSAAGAAGAGIEGVGKITAVGAGVSHLKAGDWVVPKLGFGAWRSEAVLDAAAVTRVANDIPASYAATLSVDASTAYRLLRDHGLAKGDWLIQSNASAPLGVAVVQMARELGIRTVNVIDSNSPDQEKALRLLTRLGGDVNVTDLYVHSSGFNTLMAGQKIKLAVNSANGDVVTNMARVLAPGGVLLTIDGTDADPKGYQFPAEKTPTLKTFKIADWYGQCAAPQKAAMWADIAAAVRENKLTMFFAEHDFDDFSHALGEAQAGQQAHALRRVVLRMDHPDRLAEHDALPKEAYEVFETTVV